MANLTVRIVNHPWNTVEVQIAKVASGTDEYQVVQRFRYTNTGSYRLAHAELDAQYFAQIWATFLDIEQSEFVIYNGLPYRPTPRLPRKGFTR